MPPRSMTCCALGKRIDAIKRYRALHGVDLKTAKDAIDARPGTLRPVSEPDNAPPILRLTTRHPELDQAPPDPAPTAAEEVRRHGQPPRNRMPRPAPVEGWSDRAPARTPERTVEERRRINCCCWSVSGIWMARTGLPMRGSRGGTRRHEVSAAGGVRLLGSVLLFRGRCEPEFPRGTRKSMARSSPDCYARAETSGPIGLVAVA